MTQPWPIFSFCPWVQFRVKDVIQGPGKAAFLLLGFGGEVQKAELGGAGAVANKGHMKDKKRLAPITLVSSRPWSQMYPLGFLFRGIDDIYS